MLEKFPSELLDLIVHSLPYRKDRRALWRVSRRFHELLNKNMFDTLTIRPGEHALAHIARPYGSLDASHPLECLKLVKHLHLKAPFHDMLERKERCPHHQLALYLYSVSVPDDTMASFAGLFKVMPLLLQMQDDGLVSFSWDLGTCIPETILGAEGYLTKNQTAIESLSLITGTICHQRPMFNPEIVVLTNFPNLRKFSWKGLSSTRELDSLRGLFRCNYEVLEELELDFLDWRSVTIDNVKMYTGLVDPSFTELILPHDTNRVVQQFKSLKRLSLSEFGFEKTTQQITRAFNITNLRSLTLRNCSGALTFLATILDTGLVLRLKSLELIVRERLWEFNGSLESPLIGFLQSFEGLEHFHLLRRARPDEPHGSLSVYWNAILHHSSTLKRLVYHERHEGYPDGFWTDEGLQRPSEDLAETHCYNSCLTQMRLECFGIADDPYNLLKVMHDSSATHQEFKLLHFRRTGTDRQQYSGEKVPYEDMISGIVDHNPGSWSRDNFEEHYAHLRRNKLFRVARIIFGSPKFVNLQILAFGDFSHGGRYKGRKLLLCRAATPHPQVHFRVMSRADIDFHKGSGLLDLDFLAACPRDRLLGSRRLTEFP